MVNFLVGLLVILVIIIAFLGGLFLAGVVMVLGIALIFLLKFFVVLFVVVLVIWLIGKATRGLFIRK